MPVSTRSKSRKPQLDSIHEKSTTKSKKLKLLASHEITSPFPNYPHPTPEEAYVVHEILTKEHPQIASSRTAPSASASNNSATTCGNVPNVLESLIGTILSQNTNGKNSTAAKQNLDRVFGRNDFQAMALAPKAEFVDAIRMGGLANKKAEVIQRVLKEVKERYGTYSLQHLAGVIDGHANVKLEGDKVPPLPRVTNEEAMRELVSYDGVGPKTASCVLLFCLGRASFPVDTHVFRLSRLLRWVPPNADRVTAQAHLDLKVPNELKYGLHVLMIAHGRRCKGCRKNGGDGDALATCVLKQWLKGKISMKVDVDEATVKVDGDFDDQSSSGLLR